MRGQARERAARRIGHAALRRIHDGRLEVVEGGRRTGFGPIDADLRAEVRVLDAAAWTRLLRGSTGFADGFVDGLWDSDDPVAVVRIAARNMGQIDRMRKRLQPLVVPAQRLARMVPRNTVIGARANIAAHYDLGNDLFSSFLDERLMYSSAYFDDPRIGLDEAQRLKLDRLCNQLRLEPDDHLLEIGTGWGGMAIHAAAEYGCRVTTTTISQEQKAYAARRVDELGLSDRVVVLDRDYRDLEGRFDKLVSIEMIEAVGWQYFPTFFRKCSSLLADDGLMALQAIVIADDLYEVEKASRSFANTNVFPGGCLPSEPLIERMIERETDMATAWSEDITPHYAQTLRLWRERFNEAAHTLRLLGYDERFGRLWNFYLAFSEGGFHENRIRNLQMLFAKPAVANAVTAAVAAEPALA